MTDAVRLNVVQPEVPAELASLVARMMAKNPDDRFQEPVDVADAPLPFFKRPSVSMQIENVGSTQDVPPVSDTGVEVQTQTETTGSARPADTKPTPEYAW